MARAQTKITKEMGIFESKEPPLWPLMLVPLVPAIVYLVMYMHR